MAREVFCSDTVLAYLWGRGDDVHESRVDACVRQLVISFSAYSTVVGNCYTVFKTRAIRLSLFTIRLIRWLLSRLLAPLHSRLRVAIPRPARVIEGAGGGRPQGLRNSQQHAAVLVAAAGLAARL